MTPEQWLRVKNAFEEMQDMPEAAREAALANLQLDEESLVTLRRMLRAHDASRTSDTAAKEPAGSLEERIVFLAALDLSETERAELVQRSLPDNAARERVKRWLSEQPAARRSSGAGLEGMPERLDEFKLISRIGQGGMGVVYLAEDTLLSRQVAIKVLASHLAGSDDAHARFIREAKSAAALRHPAIVPVFSFGSASGFHYLVSEYVDGQTLSGLIDRERESREKGLDTKLARAWQRNAASIIAVIADALDAAHRVGIVHRDVKPANILLDRERGPRLTDFGIATHIGPDGNATGVDLVGSCHYMSPEQVQASSAKLDHRSDVFSLGVVLYELTTLRKPFRGGDPREVMRSVVEQDPARARSFDRTIPKDLETICHKALEKSPKERYQTAAHMAADLRSFLAGDPILARPPSAARRLRRLAIKRRVPLLAALLVFAIGAAVVLAGVAHRNRVATHGRISIAVEPPGDAADVYVSRADDRGLVFSAPELVGHAPLQGKLLTAGLYRFTVLVTGSKFAQIDVRLVPGVEVKRTAWMRGASEASAGMIAFEAGTFEVTVVNPLDGSGGQAAEKVTLRPFLIDATEVSNAEYRQFISATGRAEPDEWEGKYREEIAALPVVGITLEDMQAYAAWRGKRLPTFWEWTAAAQAPDGRALPWGKADAPPTALPDCDALRDAQDRDLNHMTRHYLAHAKPVSSDRECATAAGLYHMFGNVREMTGTVVRYAAFGPTPDAVVAVIAGSDWTRDPSHSDLRFGGHQPMGRGSPFIGFRCARSVNSECPAGRGG